MGAGAQRGGRWEVLAVWILLASEALATTVTYARLPVGELYNVDRAGDLAAGLSRTLVLLCYPLALVALALAALARAPRPLVAVAVGLCALTAVPGVVDQSDLDARAVNALPALGVALAAGLTAWAWRRGRFAVAPEPRGDAARVAIGVVLLVLSLPWLAAEWGFHFPGGVFLGEERPARDPGLAAVHLGFHHGYGGVVLAASALLLSRVPAGRAVRAYLALMLSYGLANALQDGWNEQLWKREWVAWHAPDVLRPELSPAWLVVVAAAVAVYAFWFRPRELVLKQHKRSLR